MSEDAIATIRTRAELARRLAAATFERSARESLLAIAVQLEGEADALEAREHRTLPPQDAE